MLPKISQSYYIKGTNNMILQCHQYFAFLYQHFDCPSILNEHISRNSGKGLGIHCLSKVWNNIIRSEEMDSVEKPTEPGENLLRPAE